MYKTLTERRRPSTPMVKETDALLRPVLQASPYQAGYCGESRRPRSFIGSGDRVRIPTPQPNRMERRAVDMRPCPSGR